MQTKGFDAAYPITYALEKGHANDPHDPGGNTQDGITQRVYDAYRVNKKLPTQDVTLISSAETYDIYHTQYWNPVKGDALPEGISFAIYDFAVNSGATRAIEELQRVIGVAVDGSIGQHTIAALNAAMAHGGGLTVIDLYCQARLTFMKSLKTWKYFGEGWTNRVFTVKRAAEHLYTINQPEIASLTGPDPADVTKAASAAALATIVEAGPIRGVVSTPKAVDADLSAIRTTQGRGVVLSTTGTAATTVAAVLITVTPHLGPLFFMRLFVFAAIGVTAFGVFLIWWNFQRRKSEKSR